MGMDRLWRRRLLAGVLLLGLPGLAWAQDAEEGGESKRGGFWERLRLGSTIAFMSPTDKVRSHSSNFIVFRNITIASDIRFEPRVGPDGRVTLSPLPGGQDLGFRVTTDFIRDPRKDFGITADNNLEETAWLDLGAAYDLKSWKHGTLFLQLDAGYYRGEVGSIEVAVDIAEQPILNPVDQDLTADDPFANFQFIFPRAGTLTQIPTSLSALWQFRPRSPLRPYVGLGVGYLRTSLDESSSLGAVNSQLAGIGYSWSVRGELVSAGILPAETITAEAVSEPFWTAQGGLEYNINRNWSIYFSGKLIATDAHVKMRALGFQDFGIGIERTTQVDDVPGIGTAEDLLRRLLSLPVDEAVALINDINEVSPIPVENERSFFTSFPVQLGTAVEIQIPNPTDPNGPTSITRQSKLFVRGGDLQLDSFSVGLGFRYRY